MFGLFGNKVERLKKAACQRYGQHEPRRDAMIKLLAMKTVEAYSAALSRFTVNADSPHWDEKEKSWLAAQLRTRGDDTALIDALGELLKTGERLNQALAVAAELMPEEDYASQVQAAFERRLGDHRAVDACVELTVALGDLGGDQALQAGLAAVGDHNDEVVLAGLSVLESHGGDAVAAPLFGVAFDPLQMPRVVRRAGAVLARLGLSDPEGRDEIPEALAEDFQFEGGRLVARSASKPHNDH